MPGVSNYSNSLFSFKELSDEALLWVDLIGEHKIPLNDCLRLWPGSSNPPNWVAALLVFWVRRLHFCDRLWALYRGFDFWWWQNYRPNSSAKKAPKIFPNSSSWCRSTTSGSLNVRPKYGFSLPCPTGDRCIFIEGECMSNDIWPTVRPCSRHSLRGSIGEHKIPLNDCLRLWPGSPNPPNWGGCPFGVLG